MIEVQHFMYLNWSGNYYFRVRFDIEVQHFMYLNNKFDKKFVTGALLKFNILCI